MNLFGTNYEVIKWNIFELFKQWDYKWCISECDLLIERNDSLDDITFDIYGYTFKWLSYQNIDDNISAIQCFTEVDKLDGEFELVLDDLWVYFFIWLIKSKMLFYGEKDYDITDIINTTKKWFEVFPDSKKDFEDDMNNNLRLGIIYKYFVLIQSTYDIFWLKVIQLWNEDGTIKNFALLVESKDEIVAMFGYKRTNFYWDEFQEQSYRDILDGARTRRRDTIESRNKESKKTIEELINDWDFAWIVKYAQENTLFWTKDEVADGLYNLANQVWQYYNNNELAIQLYQESIKYNDTDATVYNNMATLYKNLNEFEKALEQYHLSLKHDEENPIRYFRIALLYAYQGENNDALMYAKKYFSKWWNDIEFIELCKNTTLGGGELLKLYNTI